MFKKSWPRTDRRAWRRAKVLTPPFRRMLETVTTRSDHAEHDDEDAENVDCYFVSSIVGAGKSIRGRL